jgi:hypothetical protein
MTKNKNSKYYDLEDRALQFAKDTRAFAKKLPKTSDFGFVYCLKV